MEMPPVTLKLRSRSKVLHGREGLNFAYVLKLFFLVVNWSLFSNKQLGARSIPFKNVFTASLPKVWFFLLPHNPHFNFSLIHYSNCNSFHWLTTQILIFQWPITQVLIICHCCTIISSCLWSIRSFLDKYYEKKILNIDIYYLFRVQFRNFEMGDPYPLLNIWEVYEADV